MHRRCCQRVFARARNHANARDAGRQLLNPRSGRRLRRTHDLKAELRHPVAKGRKIEILDHHIGDPAIGRRIARALDRRNLGIGKLRLSPLVHPQGQRVGGNLVAIGPDPTHAADFAFAKRNRKADRIAVLRHPAPTAALAAAGLGHRFAKAGRPDDLPPQPHAAPSPRDCHALAGPGQAKPLNPADLHRVGSRAKQTLVNDLTQRGPDGPANHRP